MNFKARGLIWRNYLAIKILPITCQIELINKKDFAKVALNENSGAFIIYIVVLKGFEIIIYHL